MGEFFNKIIAEMSELEEVEAIMLAGSQPTGFTEVMQKLIINIGKQKMILLLQMRIF